MKQPPATATRVPHDKLQTFVYDAALRADMPEERATMLARLLVENDLRGTLSHGSHQIVRYVHEIRDGGINPRPNVHTVNETPTSLLIDGDWGLGYFPLYEGTLAAIDKARTHGLAAVVSRHHGHIGAAGIYPRLAAAADMCAFTTSGLQLSLNPGDSVYKAAGGSPMSFGMPTATEPPLILDCGVTHDIHAGRTRGQDEMASLVPGLVLRMIGFGTVCQAWGGLLANLPIDPARADRPYPWAHQGGMTFVFDPKLFIDVDRLKAEMDEYAQRVRRLAPIEGLDEAFLPGGIEAEREKAYRREGIPLNDDHQRDLAELAEELELELPWE